MQKDLLASKLEIGPDSDRPRATRPNMPLCEVAKCQLCKIAKAIPELPLDLVAKCQTKAVSDLPLDLVAKCQTKAVPDLPLDSVAKCQAMAVSDFNTQLCDTARPGLDYTIAGSRPALALVAGFKSSDSDSEAGHLLELVRAQTVTKGQARKAAQKKHLFAAESAPGLIDLILKSQGTDPLCYRLKKEL